jgi:transcription antitermination factor NusG
LAQASITASWHAVYTHARHEKKVAQQLAERGVDHFLPIYHSIRRWKDRRKELDLVLFPGYVFVKLLQAERLRVLQLPGVVRFVSFNGQPAALQACDLEALRNGLLQGIRAEHHPYLTVGRRVKVVHGPLAGAQGILLRTKPNCRIVISIDAIMRAVSVEIDEEDVLPLF